MLSRTFFIVRNKQVSKLEESVRLSGFDLEYIHTGPVIRREDVFVGYSIDERRNLLYKMLNFVNSCPISCFTVKVDRKEAADKISLSGKLAREINNMIVSNVIAVAIIAQKSIFFNAYLLRMSNSAEGTEIGDLSRKMDKK